MTEAGLAPPPEAMTGRYDAPRVRAERPLGDASRRAGAPAVQRFASGLHHPVPFRDLFVAGKRLYDRITCAPITMPMRSLTIFRSVPKLALALLLVGTAGQAATAQDGTAAQASSSAGGTVQLRGTVVDGVSGHPVARALVTSLDRRVATMTNNDGQFAVNLVLNQTDAVRQGYAPRISLTAARPGFFAPETPVNIFLRGSTIDTQIKVLPAATITGRVQADDADTARGVTVLLLNKAVNDGKRRWVPAGMSHTGPNGGFTFTNLKPGDYTLFTMPWPGADPLPPVTDAPTRQYPPVFLGSAPSVAGATVLHVHYGEVTQASVRLPLATFYPVTIPVTGATGGIYAQVGGPEEISGFRLGYDEKQHAVRGALPAGDYPLVLRSSMGADQLGAELTLHVAGQPVRLAPVALTPAAVVTVRLHREFTAKDQYPAASIRVYLVPAEQVGSFVTAATTTDQEDTLTLKGVLPSRYNLHVESSNGYPAAIRCGGTDLLSTPLTISSGEAIQPIDITLRDDTGKVSGTVQAQDGTLPEGTFVALLPTNLGLGVKVASPGTHGEFTIGGVPPGTYQAIATQSQPWRLPWRDPDAMRAFGSRLQVITVTAGQELNLELPGPATGESETP